MPSGAEVRKRKTAAKADDVISPEEKQMHKARMKKWMDAEAEERSKTQAEQKLKSDANAELALKVVILVWLVIIVGIFYHVWNTIQLGREHSQSLPANAI
mmetsp:Transcript_25258/g.28007  ORF Transcript_25258/g.28007 Transcript_25258/m.28007 type:complete len:100 (+) Transcript_25258:46-345(+)